jgi:hypothetical protein
VREHEGRSREGKQHAGANDGHAEVRPKESQHPCLRVWGSFCGRLAGGFIRLAVDHAFVIPWNCPRIWSASTTLEAAFYSGTVCGFFLAKMPSCKNAGASKDAPA